MTNRRAFLRFSVGGTALLAIGPCLTPDAWALPDPEIAGYVPAKGGRLWYRINGAVHLDGPKAPLLALHGGPGGNHRSLTPLAALADERAVILYDQLDSGHSDRPGDPANWTTERFVSEIDSVRQALGLERVALLGHSMGGGWAARYAADRPEGLEALILSSPLISTPRWIADADAYRAQLPADVRRVLDKHEAAGSTDDPAYLAAAKVFYDKHLCVAPCPIGDIRNDAPSFNARLYNAMWGPTEFTATGTLKDFDLTPRLGDIAAPTLFVSGEVDEATPATCRDFAAMVPNGRYELIEDAAHTTMVEQSEDYLATIRAFLDDVGV